MYVREKYMELVIPIILSLAISDLFQNIFMNDTSVKFETVPGAVIYIGILLLISIISVTVVFLVVSNEIWNNSMEEYMYIDYKEIVEEMIHKDE